MHVYRPDRFESVFHKFGGNRIWQFLNQDNVIVIMETASYLRRPAIEPLSPLLRLEFSEQLGVTQVRQMIGHMVRQVLENRGYHLDRANVKISRPENVFHFGSAYVKSKSG